MRLEMLGMARTALESRERDTPFDKTLRNVAAVVAKAADYDLADDPTRHEMQAFGPTLVSELQRAQWRCSMEVRPSHNPKSHLAKQQQPRATVGRPCCQERRTLTRTVKWRFVVTFWVCRVSPGSDA